MSNSFEQQIEAFKELPVATLADSSDTPCDLPPEIRQMIPGTKIVGLAFTVRCPLGDNTAVIQAVDKASPGDVLVIDSGGPVRMAVWGETATYACLLKGIVGCVTNGAIRDIQKIVALEFPVFATGLSLRGSRKGEHGQIGIPISIGDVLIQPGDLVCADADGVVIISADQIDKVLKAAINQRHKENTRNELLRSGTPLSKILI